MITFDEQMRVQAGPNPATGKQYVRVKRGARNWEEEVRQDEIDQRGEDGAVSLALGRIFERVMQDAIAAGVVTIT